MFYDIYMLELWLILALVAGAIVGWITYSAGAHTVWLAGWFRWGLLVWVVGVLVAWAMLLPGRAGFWLESALLMFVSYVIGCVLGGGLRALFAPVKAPSALAALSASALAGSAASAPVAQAMSPAESLSSPPVAATSAPAPAPTAPVIPAVAMPPAPSPAVAPVPLPPTPAPVAVTAPPATALNIATSPAQPPAPSQPDAVPSASGSEPTSAAVSAPAAAPVPAKPAPEVVPEPAAMGAVEGEHLHEGQRPIGLVSARGGVPDDLKRIKGIGPQNEGRLHALGVWHFSQIAAWTSENVKWVGSYLAFPGRIDREKWIEQATHLARGEETEFSRRVERGEVATSQDAGAQGQNNVADLSKIKPHS